VLKINWFSPLPPAESGIAQNFAMQVLPELAKRQEIILWTDQERVAPEVERIARVARYDPANPSWRALNDADVSIYNLGNHGGIHGGIWQVSSRHPGVVILHDLCLHDFFAMIYLRTLKQSGRYLEILERWYGEGGRRSGEAFLAGGLGAEDMARRFPLTREAAAGALGIVTHSYRTMVELKESPACPVAALDHPFAPAAEPEYEAWLAARRTAPGPPYRLVVFGYLSRNRRLGAVLEALAGLAEKAMFRLNICGQLWDETHIRNEIERLGLGSLVSLHGFLPDSQVETQLSMAHLAINLRFPSMGEASGSQLQFFNYGLPTLVTRTGWYASLAEGTTAFVRPEHEAEDIQAHLHAFLTDPDAFSQMGERGRQFLKNYDPGKYVGALADFASSVRARAPRIPAMQLAGRIGRDLAQWLHPDASAYLLERASQEIFTMAEGSVSTKKS